MKVSFTTLRPKYCLTPDEAQAAWPTINSCQGGEEVLWIVQAGGFNFFAVRCVVKMSPRCSWRSEPRVLEANGQEYILEMTNDGKTPVEIEAILDLMMND